MIHDKTYLDLAQKVFMEGEHHDDRTGVGTRRLFGEQIKFDLQEGFPLLTTKKIFTKGIVVELLWFLRGDTNLKYLHDHGVHIWDEWADENGDLGPIYGQQWRSWDAGCDYHDHDGYMPYEPVDQISQVIQSIRENPNSRRHIVSAWRPDDIPLMGLPPCHVMFQFCVRKNGTLDMQLYQRSADLFLGVPFNIASYALLLSIIAQCTGYKPGVFTHTFGDVHIYDNHREQIAEQMFREPRPSPTLELNPNITDMFDSEGNLMWNPYFIKFVGYDPHPAIKGEVAV